MRIQQVDKKWFAFLIGLTFWSTFGFSDHVVRSVRQTHALPVGSKDTFYLFGDADTAFPTKKIFAVGRIKQSCAQKFNKGLYKETAELLSEAGIEDPELLNSIDENAPFVTITLKGIGFRRRAGHSDEVEVILVMSNRHIVMKKPISLRELAAGKKIILDDTLNKNKFGMALSSANHLELSFDPKTGLLHIHELKSEMSGKVFRVGPSDTAEFTDLIGKAGELKLPPEEKPD